MLNSSLKSRFAGIVSLEEFGLGHHFPRGGESGLGTRRLPERAVKRTVILTATDQSFVENARFHCVGTLSCPLANEKRGV
jgi:hypothetical protein